MFHFAPDVRIPHKMARRPVIHSFMDHPTDHLLKQNSKEERRSRQKIQSTKVSSNKNKEAIVTKAYLLKAGQTKDEPVVRCLAALRRNLARTGLRYSGTGLPQDEPCRQPLG